MSGSTAGSGGAPAATTTTSAPASAPTAQPAPSTPTTPTTPGAGAGQPSPSTEKLSLRQGAKALADRRKAPGEPPPRARPARAEAARQPPAGAAPQPAAEAQPQPAQRGNGADVLESLIDNFRGTAAGDAPGAQGTPQGTQQPTPRPGAAGAEPDVGTGGVALVVNGERRNYSHAELLEHVLKAHDYTAKSQQLANFAREVEQTRATVNDLLPILTPLLEQQIRALEGNLGPEPDWGHLARTDPAAYNIKRADWDMAERERRNLATLQNTRMQQSDAQVRAKLNESHNLLVKQLPGWKDPEQRGRIQQEIAKWGRANGFPDSELKNILEARHIICLTKAMMFDRLMAGAKTNAPLIPVVQRGTLPPPATEPVRNAESRFAEKTTARNGADLLIARRQAERARTNGRG
jgi:hypothetical protein